MTALPRAEAAALLGQAGFRRFLHAAIQAGGVLGQQAQAGHADPVLLAFREGRRSLALDLLALAHRGQDAAVRRDDPHGLTTLAAVLATALDAKDRALERPRFRTRYDDLADDACTDDRDARTGGTGAGSTRPDPSGPNPADAPAAP